MEDHDDRVCRLSSDQVNSLLALGLAQSTPEGIEKGAELIEDLSHSGSRALERLVEDLQCDLLWCDAGPLSFHRLTGADEDVQKQVRGRTIVEVLTSADVRRSVLDKLAAFGQLLFESGLPDDTRRAGLVIHVAALSTLSALYDIEVPQSVKQLIPEVLNALESIPGHLDGSR